VVATLISGNEINSTVVNLRSKNKEAVHRELHFREVLAERSLLLPVKFRPLIAHTGAL
jgi:hypothetical protein